ncbi:hypothetical protein EDB81DRAFT_884012 [Dactylonectria macrodidyma]|uniref:LysM domain-containing protein n=1 Tax=Dactylonectria macrodidyma TaxID=307937 RepID=A0A9P9ERT8_9HYPO|nr:hypothetical protein EDB81DRAFT_884012 [Dactylonectria macrodidyma]
MYARHLAVLVLGGFQLALGAAVTKPLQRRGATPSYPYDEKTTEYCSWWHDYDDKISCDDLLWDNQIDIEQFKRWNPSIGDDCEGLNVGGSYCVEAMFEPGNDPEEPEPSPTTLSNGIKTPDSIQPGMVCNCSKFYLVKKGDSCADIASKHDITLAEFTKWNSGTGSNCAGPGLTHMIAYPSWAMSLPRPSLFHLVKTTTTCTSIKEYYELPLATFKKWNPAVGSDCRTLLANYYVCVNTVDHKPEPETTAKPSPTVPSNGIKTPSPIQSKMHENCNKFYLVKSTTTCASISDYYKVPLKDFYSWNPSVGSTCKALLADYYVCVSVVGWKPPTPSPTKPSTPGNGISTPSPIQIGMTKNCNKFHLVKKTTTCASIQDFYKITMTQIAQWNPAVGSKCTANVDLFDGFASSMKQAKIARAGYHGAYLIEAAEAILGISNGMEIKKMDLGVNPVDGKNWYTVDWQATVKAAQDKGIKNAQDLVRTWQKSWYEPLPGKKTSGIEHRVVLRTYTQAGKILSKWCS